MKQTTLSDWSMDTITDTITPTIKPRRSMDTLISPPKQPVQTSLGSVKPVRLFSLHKLPYVYTYEGIQPTRDAYSVRKIGRNGTGRQVYYWWNEDMAGIQCFRNCFMIWIKKPKGMEMEEQLGEARERADAVARKFGMKFGLGNIRLKSEPPNEACPDVIVEDRKVAKVLKPIALTGAVPQITENQTSHKGKIETDWDTAMIMKYWLTQGKGDLIQLAENVAILTEKMNEVVGYVRKNGR